MSKKEVFKRELTVQEAKDAKKFEKVVESGQLGYVETGLALKEIRDRRLYPGQFREYVITRFDMKYHDGCRMIRAAEVAKNLKEAGLPVPRNEAQAHALHGLTAVEQCESWKHVLSENERPTAKMIEEFIKRNGKDEEPTTVLSLNRDVPPTGETSQVHSLPVEQPMVLAALDRAAKELGEVETKIAQVESFEGIDIRLAEIERLLTAIRSKTGSQVAAAA